MVFPPQRGSAMRAKGFTGQGLLEHGQRSALELSGRSKEPLQISSVCLGAVPR